MSTSQSSESTQNATASVTESVSVISESVKGETPTYRSDSTTLQSSLSSTPPTFKRSEYSDDGSDKTHLTLTEIPFSDHSEDERDVKPSALPILSEVTLFGDFSASENENEEEGAEPEFKPIRIKNEPLELTEESEGEEEDKDGLRELRDLDGIVMVDPDEYEEEEENEEKAVVHDVELSSGRVQVDFSEYAPYYVRLPNFLSVATHPFDEEHYEEDEMGDESKLDEEGKNRLKLKVENTIRWRIRKEENGQEIRESNAKIVKWDDGTMSLYLGNEIFEINQMIFNKNYRPHLYVEQGGIMSAQAIMTHRMTFRPHSTDSKTHRKVTLNMADRSRSRKNMMMAETVGVNPEIASREKAKKEEEAMRRHIRSTQKIHNNFKLMRRSNYYGGSNSDEDMPRMRRKKEEPSIIGGSDDEDGNSTKLLTDSDSDEEYRKKRLLQKKHIVTSEEEESD